MEERDGEEALWFMGALDRHTILTTFPARFAEGI